MKVDHFPAPMGFPPSFSMFPGKAKINENHHLYYILLYNHSLYDSMFPKVNHCFLQWIGLREILQENPIFHGKIYGFL